jgi:hypothetical protein
MKPSREFLTVFRAILRKLDNDDLTKLRADCIAAGDEHPATIAVLDRELALRECSHANTRRPPNRLRHLPAGAGGRVHSVSRRFYGPVPFGDSDRMQEN